MNDNTGGAVDRVARRLGGIEVVGLLAGLSGSDFARRRAARETPASVLRRYTTDRFVRPGGAPRCSAACPTTWRW